MSEQWFLTSDTHFGHSNILKHGQRPFGSVEEMDEVLIQRWNEVVPAKGGHVIFLGDFCLENKHYAMSILKRLRGTIHFIRGNHDKAAHQIRGMFADFRDQAMFKVNGRLVFACHYCCRTWDRAHYGVVHAHGHSHGTLPPLPNSRAVDVGVDTNDFRPYRADEFFAIADSRPFVAVDQHRVKE